MTSLVNVAAPEHTICPKRKKLEQFSSRCPHLRYPVFRLLVLRIVDLLRRHDRGLDVLEKVPRSHAFGIKVQVKRVVGLHMQRVDVETPIVFDLMK